MEISFLEVLYKLKLHFKHSYMRKLLINKFNVAAYNSLQLKRILKGTKTEKGKNPYLVIATAPRSVFSFSL